MTTTEPTKGDALEQARTIVAKAEDAYDAAATDIAWEVLIDTLINNIATALTSHPAPAAEVTGERVRLAESIVDAIVVSSQKYRDAKIELVSLILADAFPSPDAKRVPEGWQLVPKEPSDEMIRAIFCFPLGARRFEGTPAPHNEVVNTDTSLAIYRAMLAAAPQPNAKDGE